MRALHNLRPKSPDRRLIPRLLPSHLLQVLFSELHLKGDAALRTLPRRQKAANDDARPTAERHHYTAYVSRRRRRRASNYINIFKEASRRGSALCKNTASGCIMYGGYPSARRQHLQPLCNASDSTAFNDAVESIRYADGTAPASQQVPLAHSGSSIRISVGVLGARPPRWRLRHRRRRLPQPNRRPPSVKCQMSSGHFAAAGALRWHQVFDR